MTRLTFSAYDVPDGTIVAHNVILPATDYIFVRALHYVAMNLSTMSRPLLKVTDKPVRVELAQRVDYALLLLL
jgi:hypothetical protein